MEPIPGENQSDGSPFTLSAMHRPSFPMADIPLYAKYPKTEWLQRLAANGVEGLSFLHVDSLQGDDTAHPPTAAEEGFLTSFWTSGSDVTDIRVSCPLTGSRNARCLTKKSHLPPSSILSSVMCAVAESVRTDGLSFIVSTPQLFMGAAGGFSTSYFIDKFWDPDYLGMQVTSSPMDTGPFYRCFMHLGGTFALFPDDVVGDECGRLAYERAYCCVVSNEVAAEGITRPDLPFPTISMKSIFLEARFKHRLLPGDVLISHITFPWVLELPMSSRMEGSRILSWLVIPDFAQRGLQQIQASSPVVPIIEPVPTIEEAKDESAALKDFYDAEMETLRFSHEFIDPGDPFGSMERCRATPGQFLPSGSDVERSKIRLYHVLRDEFNAESDDRCASPEFDDLEDLNRPQPEMPQPDSLDLQKGVISQEERMGVGPGSNGEGEESDDVINSAKQGDAESRMRPNTSDTVIDGDGVEPPSTPPGNILSIRTRTRNASPGRNKSPEQAIVRSNLGTCDIRAPESLKKSDVDGSDKEEVEKPDNVNSEKGATPKTDCMPETSEKTAQKGKEESGSEISEQPRRSRRNRKPNRHYE